MKKIILSLTTVFALFACVTTKYQSPIPMSQQEIAGMGVRDRHNVRSNVGAGKITDCDSMKAIGITECAIIICKENLSTVTKLSCDIFLPESANIEVSKKMILNTVEYKDGSATDQIEKSIKDYNNGTIKPLTDYCNQDHVVCYLNKRFFPENKFASNTTYENTIHKETYALKNKSKIEITVFGMK